MSNIDAADSNNLARISRSGLVQSEPEGVQQPFKACVGAATRAGFAMASSSKKSLKGTRL